MALSKTENELLEARELLFQQNTLINKEILLKEIDEVIGNKDISPASIKKLINLLQENVDSNDYLLRKNATGPIEFLSDIPNIYIAIKLLIDFFLDNAERKLVAYLQKKEVPTHERKNITKEVLSNLRLNLITNDAAKDNYEFWCGFRHYNLYPLNQYSEKKSVFDRLDVDLILNKLHYSVLPLETAIQLHSTETQMQPGFIETAAGEAVQYNLNNHTYTYLLPPNFNEKLNSNNWKCEDQSKKAAPGNYPVRLISTQLTGANLTVLIRDQQERIWLLHVPAASFLPSVFTEYYSYKKPYIDLQPNYENPDLGLQGGNIEVVIIHNTACFDEKHFLATLPKNVTVTKLDIHYLNVNKQYKYSVCYLPDKNKLSVMLHDGKTKLIEYKNVFSTSHCKELFDLGNSYFLSSLEAEQGTRDYLISRKSCLEKAIHYFFLSSLLKLTPLSISQRNEALSEFIKIETALGENTFNSHSTADTSPVSFTDYLLYFFNDATRYTTLQKSCKDLAEILLFDNYCLGILTAIHASQANTSQDELIFLSQQALNYLVNSSKNSISECNEMIHSVLTQFSLKLQKLGCNEDAIHTALVNLIEPMKPEDVQALAESGIPIAQEIYSDKLSLEENPELELIIHYQTIAAEKTGNPSNIIKLARSLIRYSQKLLHEGAKEAVNLVAIAVESYKLAADKNVYDETVSPQIAFGVAKRLELNPAMAIAYYEKIPPTYEHYSEAQYSMGNIYFTSEYDGMDSRRAYLENAIFHFILASAMDTSYQSSQMRDIALAELSNIEENLRTASNNRASKVAIILERPAEYTLIKFLLNWNRSKELYNIVTSIPKDTPVYKTGQFQYLLGVLTLVMAENESLKEKQILFGKLAAEHFILAVKAGYQKAVWLRNYQIEKSYSVPKQRNLLQFETMLTKLPILKTIAFFKNKNEIKNSEADLTHDFSNVTKQCV